jgi:peptide-methionine (S)-S-oxide reductase
VFQAVLSSNGLEPITTEIKPLADLYLAETYHQQYLAKNPNGYCSLRGLGLSCPV